ncbi:MAG: hypothetical protein ABI333_17595 [bacterium]
MCRTSAIPLSHRLAKGLLCLALMTAAVAAGPRPAAAQRITVEADQKALTALLRRQAGTQWVLLAWHGEARLVLVNPRLSITPLGIYVAGTLKSVAPDFTTEIEVRVRPMVKGATVTVSPADILVTRPTGVWGYLPRKILTRWLRSGSGAKHLAGYGLDLAPLLQALGKPSKMTVKVRLGFGRVTLIVSL